MTTFVGGVLVMFLATEYGTAIAIEFTLAIDVIFIARMLNLRISRSSRPKPTNGPALDRSNISIGTTIAQAC